MTTTIIPEQLRIDGIKFVLIEKASKKPFEKDWTNKEYYWNNTRLLTHLANGGNYGVIGGGEKNLVILDFDNAVVQDQVCAKLPKTFTVKTGSGLLHKYFFTDHAESYKGFDEHMNTLFDLQGIGKQVIGPGSTHPNGKNYEVLDSSPIAIIGAAELKAIVMPFDKKPKKSIPDSEKPENKSVPAEYRDDTFLEQIKSKVSMTQVMAHIGVDVSKNPSNCFMHMSKGGQCLGWNDITWHCFHCLEDGNIFTAIQKWKHCTFKEALEVLAELGGMTEELKKSRKEYIEKQKKSADREKNIVIEQVANMLNCKNKNINGATEVIVDYILRNNHIYTTKDDIKSEMWIYREGIYTPNGRSEVKEIVRTVMLENFNMMLSNQVVAKIEADTYIDTAKFFNQEYLYEIPVANGILNILTRELSPFSSDKVFFNKLPVTYDVEAKCEKIDKFIQDVLATENDKKMIYELAGYCLLKEYRFEKAFIFVAGGRNGKSKLIELIKRLVGLENCSGLPLASLNPESFSISELFGKMVNIASDISSNELKDTSVFKTLTGRDPISAKRKFLRDLTFSNYAKMIFACNVLPMVQDTSRGFYDRWILLNFPYTFVPKEEYDAADDKSTLKIRDEDIINKISLPDEMSGFLNCALDGLARLLDNRGFSYEASVDEVKNNWIRKSNSFAAFCNDHVIQDYNGIISKKDLRRCYVAYCKKYKLLSKSDFVIKNELQNNYGANDSREEIMGQYTHVWEGINWIDGKPPTFKSHKNDVTEPRAPVITSPSETVEHTPKVVERAPAGASELPVQGTVPRKVTEANQTL